jgi:hypothetical protein
MAPDDAKDPSEDATADEAANVGDRPQDPIVERLRPDPAQPPEPTLELSGFLGDSDRPGFRRLYLNRNLDYFAEFRTDDVVAFTTIPAGQDPFRGEEATRLTLRRDATLEYTRTRTARPLDEFDLDIQFGRHRGPFVPAELPYMTPPDPGCPLPATPPDFECPVTHLTCPTCDGPTCVFTCPGDGFPCDEPPRRR